MDSSNSPMQDWLEFSAGKEKDHYHLKFCDRHIGNPMIRSVHGGVTAAMIEMSAEFALRAELNSAAEIHLVSSSLDYLRITKDIDLYSRTNIVRISRRLAFVDVWCWQDEEDTPFARGTCTLRIYQQQQS
ncbi:MAG: PaaI family thioesterase [Rhizobiaceae bacterium]|nr:PaaI family thioesterase [Rhizobiaceae bacterium]